jgi:hypothetical protein
MFRPKGWDDALAKAAKHFFAIGADRLSGSIAGSMVLNEMGEEVQ